MRKKNAAVFRLLVRGMMARLLEHRHRQYLRSSLVRLPEAVAGMSYWENLPLAGVGERLEFLAWAVTCFSMILAIRTRRGLARRAFR